MLLKACWTQYILIWLKNIGESPFWRAILFDYGLNICGNVHFYLNAWSLVQSKFRWHWIIFDMDPTWQLPLERITHIIEMATKWNTRWFYRTHSSYYKVNQNIFLSFFVLWNQFNINSLLFMMHIVIFLQCPLITSLKNIIQILLKYFQTQWFIWCKEIC